MATQQSAADVQLVQSLKSLLLGCIGWDNDELAENRKDAFNYYFQRARGDEVVGRSNVVTGDLSSMVEGNLAQMADALTGKRVAEFCAYSAEDEEQAQLESDCVTDMVFNQENGFIEVLTSIKDAALLRNSIIKVYVDRRRYRRHLRRTNVTQDALAELLETFKQTGRVEVHKYDPDTLELSATVVKETSQFRVVCVAPENFLRPRDWDRQDLQGIPFCAERHVDTRGDLIAMGFKRSIVESLPKYAPTNTQTGTERRPRNVGSPAPAFAMDTSQELVEWYECYTHMGTEDGTSELRRLCMSGAYLLEDEPDDHIPYATGVLLLNPHTWIGISLFDKLKSVQDITTGLTRALLDNIAATNKNRTAHLDGVVEENDLTDGRINNSIRVNPEGVGDVRAAITAFQIPDTSANILQNLAHMRSVRAEQGGAALDMATGQMQLNDRLGSQGLDRAYSVMESLAALMTKIFAHTMIRNLYLVAHEVLRTQWQKPIAFKRNKEWVTAEPSRWPVRTSLRVNLGASLGERQRMALVLEKLMDKQAGLAQQGMEDILVNAEQFYRALMDWLRVNDVAVPELYEVDPRTPQAKAAMRRRAEQTQRSQQEQKALMNQAIGLEQLRTAMEKYRTDAELQFKYWQECMQIQIEEAKLTVQGVSDARKAFAQATALRNKTDDDDTGKDTGGEGAQGESAAVADV